MHKIHFWGGQARFLMLRIPGKSDFPDRADRASVPDAPTVESWFLRYSHVVFLVCRKYLKNEEESRDAVMDIFHKILADGGRYSVSNVPAWLHAVTKNHCLMKIRKSGRMRMVLKTPNDMDRLFMENTDFVNPTDGEPPDWNALLARLRREQKSCIELFYLEKKSYREIADLTGFRVERVKSHIQNGKRNLKNILLKRTGRKNG